MKPHLLLIAPLFPPIAGVGVYRPVRLANALVHAGWAVTVVCVRPLNLVYRWEDASLLKMVDPRVQVVTLPDSVFALPASLDWLGPAGPALGNVIRALKTLACNLVEAVARPGTFRQVRALVGQQRYPTLRMDYRWAGAVSKLASQLDQQEPFTGVLASVPPFYGGVVARVVSQQLRVPYGIDFQDRWAGNPYLTLATHTQDLQDDLVAGAAAVYTASEPVRAELSETAQAPVTRLPIGFDPAMWFAQSDGVRPVPQRPLSLVHAGTVYEPTRPLTLSLALEQLPAGSVTVTFVGDTNGEFIAQTHHLAPLVQHRGLVGAAKARQLVVAADIGIAFETAAPEAVPAKIFDYLGARKPAIWVGRTDHEAAAILRECGLLVGSGSTAEELRAVLDAAVNRWAAGQPLAQPNEAAIQRYSVAAIGSQFVETMGWALPRDEHPAG